MKAHEIDFQIFGEEMQYVEIELDPQEIVIAEAGSFMMMDNNIQMQTIFGDGSQQQTGIFDKPDQRENGPPEKGQSVGGKRPQEADPVRAETNFFP